MRDKKLIIFTSGFPYGASEATFLPPEINHLARYFSKIYLVPMHKPGSRNNAVLPGNVETWDHFLFQKKAKPRSFFDRLFVIKLFIREVLDTKDLRLIKNIKYHLSEMFVYVDLAKDIDNFFKDEKFLERDYLFYSYWLDAWASALSVFKYRSGNKIEIVTRAHGFDLYDERNEKQYIFPRHLQLKNVDKIFSISRNGALYLSQKFPKFAHKICYSPLGIVKTFDELAVLNSTAEITLVSCSTISFVKRVHKIIEILSFSKKKIKWIHFGDGPLKEDVFKLTKTLPANVTVDFKGSVLNTTITKFYAENYVHWFINVSESEGIPVSIMEAICFGIPVIAPNVGGIGEIVNNITGRLVDKESDLQEIAYIIENERFSFEQREQIKIFWKENYNAESNYAEFAMKLSHTDENMMPKENMPLSA